MGQTDRGILDAWYGAGLGLLNDEPVADAADIG
jgi:hypothetical protein